MTSPSPQGSQRRPSLSCGTRKNQLKYLLPHPERGSYHRRFLPGMIAGTLATNGPFLRMNTYQVHAATSSIVAPWLAAGSLPAFAGGTCRDMAHHYPFHPPLLRPRCVSAVYRTEESGLGACFRSLVQRHSKRGAHREGGRRMLGAGKDGTL